MQKKPKKSKEEKLAENYFPVDEDDLKKTTEKTTSKNPERTNYLKKSVEKSYKEPSIESFQRPKVKTEKTYKTFSKDEIEKVEYVGKKKPAKRTPRKTSRKKTTRKKTSRTRKKKDYVRKSKKVIYEYAPPNISLKKDGYGLVITEKPQAASKIAAALGDAKQKVNNKVSYYEVTRANNEKIVVACAVGHLMTLKQNQPGSDYPLFDISWVPNYMARKGDFTKRYYDTILKLAKGAGSITIATDFDVEGEVIGMNVAKYICGQDDANRMKFSTLTKDEIENAYLNRNPNIFWGQAIAGETRHYLDWFYGINLSRALMDAIKSTGRFKIMSIGRIQGPALKLIVDKEREIQAFKSKPYWQAFITVDDGENQLELKHPKDLFTKEETKPFENLKGKKAQASTKKSQETLPPNPPFNLTTLQTEAYKFHGITPSNTLRAAQSLYLNGLISYPRTSSQKLPDSIGYKEILNQLSKKYNVSHLMKRQKPVEGNKTDPAHPSIYPTGETQVLSGDEDKIYNLIARRFLSLFCEDAIIDNKKITAEVDNLKFTAKGQAIQKKAWLAIYPSKLKENQIPDMEGEVDIINSKIEEKETKPPRRYSPASILSELEKRNLGTKATRAAILETLYNRGYVQDQRLKATPLGLSLIETLEKHSPIITDEELTRNFEEDMEKIQEAQNKKQLLEEENKILEKAKKTITEISKQFKKDKNEIGRELVDATDNQREIQREQNTLNICPKCKKGNLLINYSRKTKRAFVGCTNYPDCTNTYSLPPNGNIKVAEPEKIEDPKDPENKIEKKRVCEECGFPMLTRMTKGRRPWTFCFNPQCPTNAEWVKKREEAQKEK